MKSKTKKTLLQRDLRFVPLSQIFSPQQLFQQALCFFSKADMHNANKRFTLLISLSRSPLGRLYASLNSAICLVSMKKYEAALALLAICLQNKELKVRVLFWLNKILKINRRYFQSEQGNHLIAQIYKLESQRDQCAELIGQLKGRLLQRGQVQVSKSSSLRRLSFGGGRFEKDELQTAEEQKGVLIQNEHNQLNQQKQGLFQKSCFDQVLTPQTHKHLALSLYHSRNYDQALSQLRKSQLIHSRDGRLLAAKCCMKKNDVKRSLQILNSALTPEDHLIFAKMGWWQIKSGQLQKGLQNLQKALSLNETYKYALKFAKGVLLLKNKEDRSLEYSIHLMNKFKKQQQDNQQFNTIYVKLLALRDNDKLLLQQLRNQVKKFQKFQIDLIKSLYKNGLKNQAFSKLCTLIAKGSLLAPILILAQFLIQQKFFAEALTVLVEMNNAFPQNSSIILLQAKLYSRTKQKDLELKHLQAALSLQKDNPNLVTQILDLLLQTKCYKEAIVLMNQNNYLFSKDQLKYFTAEIKFEQGQFRECVQLLEQIESKEEKTKLKKAQCYTKMLQFDKSLLILQNIQESELLADAMLLKGINYYQKSQFRKAISCLAQANSKLPNANSHFIMGNCWAKLKDFEQAVRQFQIAIEMDEKNASSYFNLGMIHLGRRNQAKARFFIKKAIQCYPNQKWITFYHNNFNQ